MPIFGSGPPQSDGRRRLPIGRLLIMMLIAGGSLLAYFGRTAVNPVTGQKQHLSLSVDQEIALGLQAAPEMARQFGGLDPDPARQQSVKAVGQSIVNAIPKAGGVYPFDFHLLADRTTINAFALPGGQVFITSALFDRLSTEGQLAGVLGHEVGHVIERHSAQQLAQADLRQGLAGAVSIGAYDPNHPQSSQNVAIAAAAVSQMIGLRYSRKDELEADEQGVRNMAAAGYDPRAMIGVMQVLEQASGGGRAPDFFATHPNPENRIERIKAAIERLFPGGVPAGLKS